MNICSQGDYYRQNIITVFVYTIKIFGCLVNKFPPIISNDVKTCITNSALFRNILFCSIHIFPKFFQYFIFGMSLIDTNTKKSAGFANSRTHVSCKYLCPFSPK